MKRSARLFALAEALRARRTGVTAQQLADRFGVSVRTIYRDLDTLRDAAMPLHAEQGRGGGYALDRSYSLPPVNFTAREAALLVFAGELLLRMRWLPFARTLGGAIDKVRAALPRAAQVDLADLRRTLAFVGVPAHTPTDDVRAAVEAAWFEGRSLEIEYDGFRGFTKRRIRIRNVVMERTEIRLNCDDLDKGEERQFLLHRFVSARPIDDD